MKYNDMNVTSLEWWLARGIIPRWPQVSAIFRLVSYFNPARIITRYYKLQVIIHGFYIKGSFRDYSTQGSHDDVGIIYYRDIQRRATLAAIKHCLNIASGYGNRINQWFWGWWPVTRPVNSALFFSSSGWWAHGLDICLSCKNDFANVEYILTRSNMI